MTILVLLKVQQLHTSSLMQSTKGRISQRNIHHLCFGTIRPPCKYIPFVLSGYLAVLQADERAPYRINFKMCQMWRRLNYCFISNDGQQRHVSAHRCLSKSIMLIKLHARVCVWLYACVSFPLSRGRRFVEVLNEQLALVFLSVICRHTLLEQCISCCVLLDSFMCWW